MYNIIVKGLKPLFAVSLITILSIVIGADFKFSILFFVYSLILLVMPIWLKDNNMPLKYKILISIIIGLITIIGIYYLYGIHKELYITIIYLFMAILYCLLSNK